MENTRFGSGSLRADLYLPVELRSELREPIGEIMPGKMAIGALRNGERLFTIGDQCTLTFVEENIIPDVFIVDYQIKREPNPELESKFGSVSDVTTKVRNPAGMITKELWMAISESIPLERKVRIEVDGEEDLATLPCISLAQNGSQVAYGLPDQGLVLVDVDDDSKNHVRRILEKMRESNAS
jgi:uncharacterized protein (UPF0218 family)